MQVTIVSVSGAKRGNYSATKVVYSDAQGNEKEDYIMQFNKDLTVLAKTLQPGDVVERKAEKNQKGFWEVTEYKKVANRGGGTGNQSTQAAPTGGQKSGGNWETPEERAKKQMYIVRQSSLSVASEVLKSTNPSPEDLINYATPLVDWVFNGDGEGLSVGRINVKAGGSGGGIEDDDIPY